MVCFLEGNGRRLSRRSWREYPDRMTGTARARASGVGFGGFYEPQTHLCHRGVTSSSCSTLALTTFQLQTWATLAITRRG